MGIDDETSSDWEHPNEYKLVDEKERDTELEAKRQEKEFEDIAEEEMLQAERERDATEVEEKEVVTQDMLDSLAKLEIVLNEGAEKLARAERVPDGKWRISLVHSSRGGPVSRIIGGPIAQIILTWPAAQPEVKRLLQDAFRAISRNPRIIEPFAIQSIAYARNDKKAARKWIREKFGEESDILFDLIPKYRLEQKVVTEYTLTDSKTGKSITVRSEKVGHFTDSRLDNWIALSRLVRETEKPLEDDLDV